MVSFWPILAFSIALSLSPLFIDAQTADQCANINTELVVPDLLGILTAVGVIDQCLCINQIPFFLQTNVVGILAVTIAGEQVTEEILEQLINGSPSSRMCTYPPNAIPSCTPSNVCSYTCAGDTVLCSNGMCLTLCPTAAMDRRHQLAVPTSICPPNYEMCPVGHSFECVNTQTSLESCGGCMELFSGRPTRGRDCSDIPGVDFVSCKRGACEIESCILGYQLSRDHRNCL